MRRVGVWVARTSTAARSRPALKAPCQARARAVVAHAFGAGETAVSARRSTGNNGSPQCTYALGGARSWSTSTRRPQPYFILERTAVEAGQQFATVRTTPLPVHVGGIGLDAFWFPAFKPVPDHRRGAVGRGHRHGARGPAGPPDRAGQGGRPPLPGQARAAARVLRLTERLSPEGDDSEPTPPPRLMSLGHVRLGASGAGAVDSDRVRVGGRLPVQVPRARARPRRLTCAGPCTARSSCFAHRCTRWGSSSPSDPGACTSGPWRWRRSRSCSR